MIFCKDLSTLAKDPARTEPTLLLVIVDLFVTPHVKWVQRKCESSGVPLILLYKIPQPPAVSLQWSMVVESGWEVEKEG